MSCRKGSLIVVHKVQTNTESTAKVVTAVDNLVNGPAMVTINNTSVSAISANIATSGSNTGKIKSRMNVKSYIGKRYSERLV